MKDLAVKYFMEGYSCSESIVRAAADKGYISDEAVSIATSFSGGMGARCLCGAVAGSQMVIGAMFGRNNERDGKQARALAKQFHDEFTAKYKVACCKVLSSGFADFHSPERRRHCSGMVNDCAMLLENIIKVYTSKV